MPKPEEPVVEEQIMTVAQEMPDDHILEPTVDPAKEVVVVEPGKEQVKETPKPEIKSEEPTIPPKTQVYEEIAKAWGWIGKKNFHGKEEDFIDAETFVKNERNISQTSQLKNKRLVNDVEHIKSTMVTVLDHQDKLIETRIKADRVKLQKEKVTAIQDSDVETVQEIDKQINVLNTEEIELKDAPAPTTADPVFDDWQEENKWYGKDAKLTKIADGLADKIAREDGLYGSPLFEAVSIKMKKGYLVETETPSKEETTIPETISTEEIVAPVIDGRPVVRSNTLPTFESLSREQKDAIDSFREIQGDKFDEKKYIKELVEIGVVQ